MKKINSTSMIICFHSILYLLLATACSQQKIGYKTVSINKTNREFPQKYNFDTPLNAYSSFNYMMATGRDNLWRKYSTKRFYDMLPSESTPSRDILENLRNEILNRKALECIIYNDSVAAVIACHKDSIYYTRFLNCENGKWVNAGEDHNKNGIDKTREKAHRMLAANLSYVRTGK